MGTLGGSRPGPLPSQVQGRVQVSGRGGGALDGGGSMGKVRLEEPVL